jgi:hypothetical protein
VQTLQRYDFSFVVCVSVMDVSFSSTKDYQREHLRLTLIRRRWAYNLSLLCKLVLFAVSAKYEFASRTTRTTVAFDACFVWKLAPLADEQSGFFIENLS